VDGNVDVPIPFEPEIARALENPVRREAAGCVGLLKSGHLPGVLGKVIAAARQT
jgi:hypothetical protein